jgi:hypothetical protein
MRVMKNGRAVRRRWTDADVEQELRIAVAKKAGAMPSANELRAMGLNALACQLARTGGGYRAWARKLGLAPKSSETAFGQKWEEYVAGYLRALRYDVVQQTTKAPFDLLVNGRFRINVKSATWHEYGACRGYFFGLANTWRHCDVFALVRVQQDSSPLPILWVPAGEAQQQTITLTGKHRFNTYTAMPPEVCANPLESLPME